MADIVMSLCLNVVQTTAGGLLTILMDIGIVMIEAVWLVARTSVRVRLAVSSMRTRITHHRMRTRLTVLGLPSEEK